MTSSYRRARGELNVSEANADCLGALHNALTRENAALRNAPWARPKGRQKLDDGSFRVGLTRHASFTDYGAYRDTSIVHEPVRGRTASLR